MTPFKGQKVKGQGNKGLNKTSKPRVMGSFLQIFSLRRPSILDWVRHVTDRRTDRRRQSRLNAPPYGGGE